MYCNSNYALILPSLLLENYTRPHAEGGERRERYPPYLLLVEDKEYHNYFGPASNVIALP